MATPRYRGVRVKRIEDPRLLVGSGMFVDDISIPGLWHVVVVRSPHAHARIRRVQTHGVRGVVTARTLGDPMVLSAAVDGGAVAPHPLLARDRVHYVGQPVALVLASRNQDAADLAERVEIEYEPLEPVLDAETALKPGAALLHPRLRTNVAYRESWQRGAGSRAFASAETTISKRIHHQRIAAISLEGRAVLAVPPQGRDRTLTVWSSTQMPHGLRDELQELLPLRGAKVRVIAPDVGGGFGAKGTIYPEELLVPLLALRLGRPLKWVESRREHLMTTTHGRSQFADVTLAASRDGRIQGLRLRVVADVGAYLLNLTAEIPPLTLLMATGPYVIRNVEVELVEAYTNKTPTGPYRGAGRPEATFYLERAIDILASTLHLDPVEIRRRNFITPESFPYRVPSGLVYDSGNYARALERAVQVSSYLQWRERQAQARQASRYLGIGISSYVETCTFGSDASRLELNQQGRVTVYSGTSPHGQGGATAFAQIVAETLGVEVQEVGVICGDTALIREGNGTAGSRTLVVGGSAVYRASQALRRKLLDRASRRLEASPKDLVFADGRIFVAGVPAHGVALGDLVDTRRKVLGATGRYVVRGSTFPFGTHVAVVEVDVETGAVHLVQHFAVDDCGVVVNPLLVEGQVHGGVAQGIGQALCEAAEYDASGQLLTGSLLDYALPRSTSVPHIVTARTETPSPRNPLGAKGVGEAGTIGSTPAIVNAVIDALTPFGVRHLDMPLTPAKIWAALHGRN